MEHSPSLWSTHGAQPFSGTHTWPLRDVLTQLSLAPRVQMAHTELRDLALSLSSLGSLHLPICLSVFMYFRGTLADVASWGKAPEVGWVNGDRDCHYCLSKIPSTAKAFSLSGSSLPPPRCTAYACPTSALYGLWGPSSGSQDNFYSTCVARERDIPVPSRQGSSNESEPLGPCNHCTPSQWTRHFSMDSKEIEDT